MAIDLECLTMEDNTPHKYIVLKHIDILYGDNTYICTYIIRTYHVTYTCLPLLPPGPGSPRGPDPPLTPSLPGLPSGP